MDSSWKNSDMYFFFFSKLSPLLELCPFEKNQNDILSVRYLEKYLSLGLETWSADREWWVNYLINWNKFCQIFLELWPFENLGMLNL